MAETNSNSVTTRRGRRWLRFSVRTLLVVMAIAAVSLAFPMNRIQDRHYAIEALRTRGDTIVFEGQTELLEDEEISVQASTPGRRTWLGRLLGKYGAHLNSRVEWISVGGTTPDGADFDLSQLAPFEELQRLHLDAPTNAKLLRLPELPNLNLLSIGRHGRHYPLGDEGLECLERMPSLTDLRVRGATFTSAVYRQIASRRNLKSILLENCNLAADGLDQLATLPNLTLFGIRESAIGDEAIPHISQLQSLKSLDVVGSNLTKAGIEKLRTALPDCEITPRP